MSDPLPQPRIIESTYPCGGFEGEVTLCVKLSLPCITRTISKPNHCGAEIPVSTHPSDRICGNLGCMYYVPPLEEEDEEDLPW